MRTRYKVEVWNYYSVIGVFETTRKKQAIEWIKKNYSIQQEEGTCFIQIYVDGRALSIPEMIFEGYY